MRFHNAKEVVSFCEENGMLLWTEGARLRYKAPELLLNNGILEALKEHKPGIMEFLEERRSQTAISVDRASRYQPFPMTDVQSAYVLGRKDSFKYAGVACHTYLELIYGQLDAGRVKAAWERLIDRHDMLRAVMYENGYQEVLEECPELELPVVDGEREPERLLSLKRQMSSRVYELGSWPMFGVALSQYPDKSVMHLSIEFLIADWTSVWMLLSEFESCYFEPGRELPPFALNFRDYVLGAGKLKESGQYQADRSYWLAAADELPPAPQLPVLREEALEAGFSREFLSLERPEWERLRSFAGKHGVTPAAAVMTAYGNVLELWSSNKDFTLNLTVLSRQPLHADINKIVGDFTSTSLLAMKAADGASFAAKARQISRRLFENLDHGLYSGIELLRELSRRRGRDAAMMPYVFTSAIGLFGNQRQLRGSFRGDGISQTPQVFIDCQAMDGTDGLQINWDVRDGVFPRGMVRDMFSAFREHLRDLALREEAWTQPAHIPLPAWQQAERAAANRTETALDTGLLHEKFLMRACCQPERTAVADGLGAFTYRQLDERARAIAARLRELGGKPGDRVAVVMEKSRHQVAAVLGILYMGGVYIPIDVKSPEARRSLILANGGAAFAIVDKGSGLAFPQGVAVFAAEEPEDPGAAFRLERVADTQPAYIIFTSGTTGEPKGVVISHRGAVNTIEDINARFGVHEEDAVLGLSQLYFDLSVYDIFGLLSAGGSLIFPEKSGYMSPGHWLDLLRRYRITIWNSVPAFMQMLLARMETEPAGEEPGLRLALLSGDWIPLAMPELIGKHQPHAKVVCMGGATEASIWSIAHEYRGTDAAWSSIPYGRPLANQSFRVLDVRGRDCPVWAAGQLFIAGAGLALEYANDPQLTAARFAPDAVTGERMYATGDSGRYLPGGEIEFLGRMDEQVKLRGYRIEPGEIEHAFKTHPALDLAVAKVDAGGEGLPIQVVARTAMKTNYSRDGADQAFVRMSGQVEECAADIRASLETVPYREEKRAQEEAAYTSMIYALQQLGFFTENRGYALAEVAGCTALKASYRWVVKHWIYALEAQGYLKREGEGLVPAGNVGRREYDAAWEKAFQLWREQYGDIRALVYFKECADQLPRVARGELDPIALLYPQGSRQYPEALYVDNIAAAVMSRFFCELVSRLVKEKAGRKVRILEIGSGTGATTRHVLKALEGKNFEYVFSDISKYFFAEARERFGHIPGLTIRQFNLDLDIGEQGFEENSFDIILAAYVLNNVKDIRASLGRIEELAAPSGYVLFSEPVCADPALMISQAFLMTEPEDELRRTKTFISREEWLELLGQVGGNSLAQALPARNSVLYELGAALYVKQFKRERAELDREEIGRHVAAYLPDYMLPSRTVYVHELPLTANGKIDREAAFRRLPAEAAGSCGEAEEEPSGSELERRLAEIWKAILKTDALGRRQSFYDFGADSLVMAQSVTRMKQELQLELSFDVLLRHILNHPTLEELAEFLAAQEHGPEGSAGSTGQEDRDYRRFAYVKSFGGGDAGRERLRVLLHGALGTVDGYQHLGAGLASQNQGEVIAIGIADMDAYCSLDPNEVIGFLADAYAELLMERTFASVQLIGYSFSGAVAIELAKRLVETGIQVEPLSIIEGGSIPVSIGEELVYELIFIDNIRVTPEDLGFQDKELVEKAFIHMAGRGSAALEVQDFRESLTGKDDRDRLTALAAMPQKERLAMYASLYNRSHAASMEADIVERLYRFFRQSFTALSHIPDAYFGDIRYFAAKEKEGAYKHFALLLDQWNQVCLGEMTVAEINGNHYTCVEEEAYAYKLAQLLQPEDEEGGSSRFPDPHALEPEPSLDGEEPPAALEECDREARALVRELDAAYLKESLEKSERLVFYAMLHFFQQHNLFHNGRAHTLGDIAAHIRCAPDNEHIIARWLQELTARDYLRQETDGYRARQTITGEMLERARAERRLLWNNKLGSPLSAEYLEDNLRQLPGLVSGEISPALLLFPEGKTDYARSLYKDTIVFRYLNGAIAAGVRLLLQEKRKRRPKEEFVVLEVGAGTGASSDLVIPALEAQDPRGVTYFYTDLSSFFLEAAKERYHGRLNMAYRLLNIDLPFQDQGIQPESVDVVIANGVLNNAVNIHQAIGHIRQCLRPGGHLFVSEPTAEAVEILVSQAFMMSRSNDERSRSGATFLTHEQWLDALRRGGIKPLADFPSPRQPIHLFGQKLYIAAKGAGLLEGAN